MKTSKQEVGTWWLIASCGLVFLLSAALRISFVQEVLNQHVQLPPDLQMSQWYGYMAQDSMDYLEPAAELARGNFLNAGSLVRPPGYPVMLAACGRDPFCILIAQAILGSLIPVCTLLLTFYIVRNFLLSMLAGLVSSFSPTGVGITGLIMSDLLFAVLFTVGLLLLVYGSAKEHNRWIFLSALIFGLGVLVKPILFAWALLSVVIWALLRYSENKSLTWWPPITLLCVQGFFVVSLSTYNYLRDGVFTVSETGACTMRHYWAVRVEEWARAGHDPDAETIVRNRHSVYTRLHDKQLTPWDRMTACRDESFHIFRRYPTYTLLALLSNIKENTEGGWDRYPLQVPLNNSLLMVSYMATRVESLVRTSARWPVILGFVFALILLRLRAIPESRRIALGILALSAAYFYFGIFSGVTFWTGPRILYPVETLAITIVAAEAYILAKLIRGITEMLRHQYD